MSNVVAFPEKKEPLDDVTVCVIEINGKGEIELILNVEVVETVDQYNWLIAKISEATSRLIDRKHQL